MTPRMRTALLLFSLLGLGASVAAAYVHYQSLSTPGYTSFCDVSATFSCSQVYASRYGSVAGVSVAAGGVVFFLATTLLLVGGFAAGAVVRENLAAYLFAASTIGLAVVLYLGYASFVVLGMVCVLCLLVYAAVIGLFLISGSATTFPMTSLPARAASDLKLAATNPLAVALAVLFLASTVSLVAFFPREGRSVIDASAAPAAADAAAAQGQPSEFERYYTSLPRMSLVVPNEGAKVLIVKFNDYQCPACGKTHTEYKSVLAKYEASNPGAVKLVTKDYPIESECNNNTTSNLHPASCEAAVAVRLAREHNRAEALEDWLVENQARLTPQLVREGARTVGQVADFDARYPVILEQVKADIAYGRQLGVNATPTFFVNGVRIPGGLHPAHFDQAIAYELARAK